MDSKVDEQLMLWIKTLPSSRMVYPNSLLDKMKYVFWRFYTPFHPFVRDTSLSLGIVKHEGRDNFLIGKIAPHLTIEQFIQILLDNGYGNHFIAWHEEGELASLRYVDNFMYQYHIRVFEDGEVRGHYEYTPECYPLAHYYAVDMEDRSKDFLQLLHTHIIQ
jgi:hypothetical protein